MNKVFVLFMFMVPLTSFAGVKILYNEKETLYVEAPSRQVFLHCSIPGGDDPETASFTYIQVVAPNAIYEFMFRRPWSLDSCRYRLGKMRKILQKNKLIRVFGILPKEEKADFLEFDADGNRPPRADGKKIFSSIFQFLEGDESGCHGYFENTCEDPNRAINDRGRDF